MPAVKSALVDLPSAAPNMDKLSEIQSSVEDLYFDGGLDEEKFEHFLGLAYEAAGNDPSQAAFMYRFAKQDWLKGKMKIAI